MSPNPERKSYRWFNFVTAVFVTTNPFAITGFVQIGLFPDGAAWLPPAPVLPQ